MIVESGQMGRDGCDVNGWTEQISSQVRVAGTAVWSLVPNVWKVSVLTCKTAAVLDVRVTLVCLNSSVSLEDDVIKNTGPSWVHCTYKEYAISDHIASKELTGRVS